MKKKARIEYLNKDDERLYRTINIMGIITILFFGLYIIIESIFGGYITTPICWVIYIYSSPIYWAMQIYIIICFIQRYTKYEGKKIINCIIFLVLIVTTLIIMFKGFSIILLNKSISTDDLFFHSEESRQLRLLGLLCYTVLYIYSLYEFKRITPVKMVQEKKEETLEDCFK